MHDENNVQRKRKIYNKHELRKRGQSSLMAITSFKMLMPLPH